MKIFVKNKFLKKNKKKLFLFNVVYKNLYVNFLFFFLKNGTFFFKKGRSKKKKFSFLFLNKTVYGLIYSFIFRVRSLNLKFKLLHLRGLGFKITYFLHCFFRIFLGSNNYIYIHKIKNLWVKRRGKLLLFFSFFSFFLNYYYVYFLNILKRNFYKQNKGFYSYLNKVYTFRVNVNI